LSKFVREFATLGVSNDGFPLTVQVKFGRRVDQDERPALRYEEVHKYILTPKELEWDLKVARRSLKSVSEALAGNKRTIYRAFIELGAVSKDVSHQLSRIKSPENETDLALDSWSLQIDPIMSSGLDSEVQFFVGWISAGLSGGGYLYPWTPSKLVRRADKHPGIRQLKELCQTIWPVENKQPNQREKKLRKKMGALWPYDSVDLRWDWYWGIEETG
jgi:hypothetical protein